MNINNLHQLFESVITKLTNTLEIIDNYESQYKEYKTNKNDEQKNLEEEYDQLKDILELNNKVIECESDLNETISQTISQYMEYFWNVKQTQIELKKDINKTVDELLLISKKELKQNYRQSYHQKKEELEQKYIETEDIKQRQQQRREKEKRKELEKQFELKWEEMIESNKKDEEEKENEMINEKEKEDKEMGKYYEKIKILYLGDKGIGSKTSFIQRYMYQSFSEINKSSNGIDYSFKVIEYNNQIVEMELLDTIGNEKYREINGSYISKTDGVIIGYDITNRKSFELLDKWFEIIQKRINENMSFFLLDQNVI